MRWGILRVLAIGIVLFKRPRANILYLDTLAVCANVRGQGIREPLIHAVEVLAQFEGRQRGTLAMEDINPRAKELY
jgi:hypothetical protein